MKPPDYRRELATGVVHFGPGAFHRAHQADYFHRMAREDPRWGVAVAALRSRRTIDELRRQNGLYTLAILDHETCFRTIGIHTSFFAPTDAAAVRRQLRDPAVRIISSTVTEKGYCLNGDGTLDFDHPDIIHDLSNPAEPVSIIGWLALGLSDRRREGLPPFTPLCCDNMASNGRKLGAAVGSFAARLDPELARWIEGEVRFPDSMVDSITPASDGRLRELVRLKTGSDDAVPVSREAYSAWVIEDILPPGLPDFGAGGAVVTTDVAAWEKAKLRILNGAHSTLAYLGLLARHETVSDAMNDPLLSAFVECVVREDIVPTLEPSPLNLQSYATETLERFRNRAIHHRLSQIAWDGSQKLPYRLLDTVREARVQGRPLHRLAMPIAAWMLFLERQARAGAEITDPIADRLAALATGPDPVAGLLQLQQVFPQALACDTAFETAVKTAFEHLRSRGIAALQALEMARA